MVRETPFNLAHLRNMTAPPKWERSSSAAAGLLPPAASIDEMVDESVERVLSLLGIVGARAREWDGPVKLSLPA